MAIDLRLVISLCIALFLIYFIYCLLTTKNRKTIHFPFFLVLFFELIGYIGFIWMLIFPAKGPDVPFSVCIVLIGFMLAATAFLITSIVYLTGVLHKRYFILFYFAPAVFTVIILTNSFHHLILISNSFSMAEIKYGYLYYWQSAYTYLVYLAGSMLFMLAFFKKHGFLSKQVLLFFGGALAPAITDILITYELVVLDTYATLYVFGVTILCYWYAIFRYGFIDIIPIAIRRIINSISDAFIQVDENLFVVEYNQAFADNFIPQPRVLPKTNLKLTDILSRLDYPESQVAAIKESIRIAAAQKEIVQWEEHYETNGRFFQVEVSSLIMQNHYLGALIFFKDMTAYKIMLQQVKTQQEELLLLNTQLKDYIATLQDLTLEKERSRVEVKINKLLGHNLSVLLRLIEVIKWTFYKEPEKAFLTIQEAESTVKNTMNNVRQIARGVMTGDSEETEDTAKGDLEL